MELSILIEGRNRLSDQVYHGIRRAIQRLLHRLRNNEAETLARHIRHIGHLADAEQAQRADIAHGIFGHVAIEDDTVIPWIETKKLSKSWIEQFYKPRRENDHPKVDATTAQKRESFVYKTNDLEQLEREIKDLWGVTFSFTVQLRWPGNELANQTFETQCKTPQMQTALSEVRKRRSAFRK